MLTEKPYNQYRPIDSRLTRGEILFVLGGLVLALTVFLFFCHQANAAERAPASYGAKGDGVTDDSAALQRMLDALRPGDTVKFPATKTFRMTVGMISHCPDVTIDVNGATLKLDTSTYPNNTHLRVSSDVNFTTPATTFTGAITAGWYTLPLTPARPGYVFLELGTDPFDASQPHFSAIVAAGDDRVWVPYDVNGTSHKWYTVNRLCERVTVKRPVIRTVAGRTADMSVAFDTVRDCALYGLRGEVTIGCQLINVTRFNMVDTDVTLTFPHESAGRAFSAWQSHDVTVDGLHFRSSRNGHGSNGIFMESWCSRTRFNDVDGVFTGNPAGNFPIFFVNGGCLDTVVTRSRFTMDTGTQCYLYDVGGQPDQEEPRWDVVEVARGSMIQIDSYVSGGTLHIGRLIRP